MPNRRDRPRSGQWYSLNKPGETPMPHLGPGRPYGRVAFSVGENGG
jgi:hypothetical protein